MDAFEELLRRKPELADCIIDIKQAITVLKAVFRHGGKLLVCGNGGSAADSEHIVAELMKSYRLPRPIPAAIREKLESEWPGEGRRLANHLQGALPAISLVSQLSLITAYINDVDPEMIFAQQVYGYGRPGDALLALSTSGTAANVINALKVGRALGLHTLGLTGRGGGEMPPLCDTLIRVPQDQTANAQEDHLAIYHFICAILEQEFFGP